MKVNIHQQLVKHRNKQVTPGDLIQQVYQVLEQDTAQDKRIMETLLEDSGPAHNQFNPNLLETDRIFHLNDIKKICIDYRLRFLESNLFKGDIPAEAISKIKVLEKTHQTTLKGFMLMAPSKLFRLENYDDPLLFAPIGNGYYYLIHQWGNDLNRWRKWLMYPFRSFDTMVASALIAAFLIALSFPESYFNPKYKITQFIFLFFFMFKVIGFCLIFFGVSKGKNFNSAIWNSTYVNA